MDPQALTRLQQSLSKFELFMKALPQGTNKLDIQKLFNGVTQIKSIDLIFSRNGKGVSAIVNFYDFKSMIVALESAKRRTINGKRIDVIISRYAILFCTNCNRSGHDFSQCRHFDPKNPKENPLKFPEKYEDNSRLKHQEMLQKPNFKSENGLQDRMNGLYQRNLGSYRFAKAMLKKIRKRPKNKEEQKISNPEKPKPSINWATNSENQKSLKKISKQGKSIIETSLDMTRYNESYQQIDANIQKGEKPSKNRRLMKNLLDQHQEQEMKRLWAEGFFDDFSDEHGPIVRII